eukprot:9484193-Pyramimonas_sp.AAC.1
MPAPASGPAREALSSTRSHQRSRGPGNWRAVLGCLRVVGRSPMPSSVGPAARRCGGTGPR